MPVVRLVCYLLAFACFVVAAIGWRGTREGRHPITSAALIPAGLAFWEFPDLLGSVYAVE